MSMRDLPSGAVLLALARDVLLEDLLPLLPEEAHIKARLIATCMAIAAREAVAGQGPVENMVAAFQAFYSGYSGTDFAAAAPHPGPLPASGEREGPAAKPWEGEGLPGAGAEVENVLRRLALDLRRGAFETSESQERAACAILWRLTIAKLREGNPGFLAANGISGS
jgi:hypothetical protein